MSEDLTGQAFIVKAGDDRVGGMPDGLFFPGLQKIHDVSDGHHTFGDLYDHRRALTRALALAIVKGADGVGWRSWREINAWRSKRHHPENGPMFEGYFVIGFNLGTTGQVSYHYKLEHWDEFEGVPALEYAPRWDGHTPEDTVARLLAWTPV